MRLHELRALAADQVSDVDTLVALLELTIEDILERHPDALMDHQEKFGVFDGNET